MRASGHYNLGLKCFPHTFRLQHAFFYWSYYNFGNNGNLLQYYITNLHQNTGLQYFSLFN